MSGNGKQQKKSRKPLQLKAGDICLCRDSAIAIVYEVTDGRPYNVYLGKVGVSYKSSFTTTINGFFIEKGKPSPLDITKVINGNNYLVGLLL